MCVRCGERFLIVNLLRYRGRGRKEEMLLEVHVVGHGRPAETSGHAPTRPLFQLEKWAGMGEEEKKKKIKIEKANKSSSRSSGTFN